MLTKSSSNKVFSRFNRTIILVFALVIFIALALAAVRYFRELSDFEDQAERTMNQQAMALNGKLVHSVQAISGLLEFANYCLKYPENTNKLLPKLAQEGDLFYLDLPRRDVINQRTQLSGNITGIGDINHLDPQLKQELAMANALTPAFITAQHTNPEVTWFYYVSKKRFVNLFPWVSRSSWRYSDQLIKRDYFTEIQKKQRQGEFYWSPPYSDSAGKGLTASLAAGVTQLNKFVGALIIDINLNELDQTLPDVLAPEQGYLLLDQNQHVLLHKSLTAEKITHRSDWQEIVPSVFGQFSIELLNALGPSQKVGKWFIQKQVLPINQWVLIKYQLYDEFISPLAGEFLFWFIVLFIGLTAFILLIYFLTRTTFIKPATEFIQHIENCAQGDSGKIKPTADWQHWFHVVEDIFSQNRSLMQQLKDKNIDLDKRVKEKTQDLLKTSEQRQRDYALLRSVMNAMPELIIFSDPKGNLIGCNLALEKFIDKKESVILDFPASKLLPQTMSSAFVELSSKSYQDGAQKAYQQVVKTDKHTFELFSRRFFNDLNEPLGTINIFRDVTEAYAIQAALEQAKNQAVQANQAKGQFLANMSHEIRTPLNAIQGMMYLLEKTPLNRVQQQYLVNAETASKSLLYLIDELLDLAKIEAGKMPLFKTQITLDHIIDKALKLNIGKAHQKKITVTVDIAADVPDTLYSDEIRLVQVLTNLLNNAVKFTDQGQVNLFVETINHNAKIYLSFRVLDTGIGIAQEKQINLFNAFTQADESMTRKYGGSGLGLSICQQIVDLLGGKLTLKSELGQGSEFSFSLPLSQQKNASTYSDLIEPSMTIVTVASQLPASLLDKFIAIGWQYQEFSQLAQLESANLPVNSVLLLEPQQLLTEQALFVSVARKFSLIALCLPMLAEISETLNQQVEQLNIPWTIIEKPFYRVLIEQIITAVAVKQVKADDLLAVTAVENIKVLLVEDNLVNQMVAQELLKSMKIEVVLANNGQEALDLLVDNKVDLVLMDIQMPVMDGLTATRRIRAMPEYKNLPIIAMTAHAREEDHQLSFAAGMNKHIAKPVNFDVLLASIKAVI